MTRRTVGRVSKTCTPNKPSVFILVFLASNGVWQDIEPRMRHVFLIQSRFNTTAIETDANQVKVITVKRQNELEDEIAANHWETFNSVTTSVFSFNVPTLFNSNAILEGFL